MKEVDVRIDGVMDGEVLKRLGVLGSGRCIG